MMGNAGHLDRIAARCAALRERQVEQARGFDGVVEEQLVEVAHAVKHERAGMLRFDAQILLHHGSVMRQIDGGGGFRRGGAQVLSGRRNGDMRAHLACVNWGVSKGTSVPRQVQGGTLAEWLTVKGAQPAVRLKPLLTNAVKAKTPDMPAFLHYLSLVDD